MEELIQKVASESAQIIASRSAEFFTKQIDLWFNKGQIFDFFGKMLENIFK